MLLTTIHGENDKPNFIDRTHQQHPQSSRSVTMPTTTEPVRQRTPETIEAATDKTDVTSLNEDHERPEEDTETVLDLTVVSTSDSKSGPRTFSYPDHHRLEGDEQNVEAGPRRTPPSHERNSLYFPALRRHGNGVLHGRCELAEEQASRHTTSFMVDDILNPDKFRGDPAVCLQHPGGRLAAERRVPGGGGRGRSRSMDISGNLIPCSVRQSQPTIVVMCVSAR